MRIIIDQGGISPESDVGRGYRTLKSLSFTPQAGILGQAAPVTEFVGEIITADEIEPGDYTRLRDDVENLWAQYWLTSARRIDGKTVRVVGRSDLMLLDRPRMPATFYTSANVADLVEEIFDAIGYNRASGYYTLDATIGAQTLTGFCPEQTARERLQWVCFAAGAYIRTWFCQDVQILPIPDPSGTPTLIPIDRVFMRPRITEEDYVTAVSARAYSFTQREPQSGESYVTDQGGLTYVYTTQDITISNPDLQPAEFPVNTVDALDVMLLDATRASAAASALARYCFNVVTIEADVIDNGGEYIPGMLVTIPVAADKMYTGYIISAAFRFGVQARATLTIAGAHQTPCARLTVIYKCGVELLGMRRYFFPVGYAYDISNDYLDINRDGVRRVFRPLTESVQGTMTADGATEVVQYAEALILKRGILDIISVDEIDMDVEEESTIGVIT